MMVLNILSGSLEISHTSELMRLRALRFGLFLQSIYQPINIFMSIFTKVFNHKTFIQ